MTAPGKSVSVLRLSNSAGNCIRLGDSKYVLLRLKSGPLILINVRCPHRGGPLHLGRCDESGEKIICPMHRLGFPVAQLERRALPIVIRSDLITVVVSNPENQFAAPVVYPVMTTLNGSC
jgi:nitrite reductase (NADH) small subunit